MTIFLIAIASLALQPRSSGSMYGLTIVVRGPKRYHAPDRAFDPRELFTITVHNGGNEPIAFRDNFYNLKLDGIDKAGKVIRDVNDLRTADPSPPGPADLCVLQPERA